MTMRVAFGVASVAAMVGMLWGSVRPAAACSCAGFPTDSEQARIFLELPDVVVAGRGVIPQADTVYADRVHVKMESVLSGTASELLATTQRLDLDIEEGPGGMCDYYLDAGSETRHLITLLAQEDGTYEMSGCGSFRLDLARTEGYSDYYSRILAALEAASGVHVDPEPQQQATPQPMDAESASEAQRRGEDDSDFPLLPAAALATLGPLAFLAGAAFLWRRGG